MQPLSTVIPEITIRDGRAVTTSIAVAGFFEKRHDNVIAKISTLDSSPKFNALNFKAVEYTDTKGEKRPAYEMTRNGFIFLVMGFTGKKAAAFKEAYIAEFDRMEAELRSDHQQQPEVLPIGIYRQRSKINPYRVFEFNGHKRVYIGCYPTVKEAIKAQKQFFLKHNSPEQQELLVSESPVSKQVPLVVETQRNKLNFDILIAIRDGKCAHTDHYAPGELVSVKAVKELLSEHLNH